MNDLTDNAQNMNEEQARQTVCDAGKRLLREGLVARTWGNVSVRLSDGRMVITPSGRRYEELGPGDMVAVKLADGSYEGSMKPSSEWKLHAEIYRRRPEAGAVIHTHQLYASVVAAARKDVEVRDPGLRDILGTDLVRAAPYALPNTKKITTATADALGKSNAALMSNHGAVCCGRDLEAAFSACRALEAACESLMNPQTQKT